MYHELRKRGTRSSVQYGRGRISRGLVDPRTRRDAAVERRARRSRQTLDQITQTIGEIVWYYLFFWLTPVCSHARPTTIPALLRGRRPETDQRRSGERLRRAGGGNPRARGPA